MTEGGPARRLEQRAQHFVRLFGLSRVVMPVRGAVDDRRPRRAAVVTAQHPLVDGTVPKSAAGWKLTGALSRSSAHVSARADAGLAQNPWVEISFPMSSIAVIAIFPFC